MRFLDIDDPQARTVEPRKEGYSQGYGGDGAH
ncbi:hypothetical protein LJR267_010448 [Paraburkholderia hospita]